MLVTNKKTYFDIRNGEDTDISIVFTFDPILINALYDTNRVPFTEFKFTGIIKEHGKNKIDMCDTIANKSRMKGPY